MGGSVVFRLAPCGCLCLIINWRERKKSRGARRQCMSVSSDCHPSSLPRVCQGRRVAQGQTTSAPTLPDCRRNGREAIDEPRQSTIGRLGVLSVFARCWVTLAGSAIKGQPCNVSLLNSALSTADVRKEQQKREASSFTNYRKVFIICSFF